MNFIPPPTRATKPKILSQAKAKEILHKGTLTAEDKDKLQEFFKQHPNYEHKIRDIGGELTDIVVAKSDNGPGSCFYMVGPSSRIDIGIKKCTNLETYNKIKRVEFARNTVRYQILDFRNKTEQICVLCDSVDNLEVDHEKEFCILLKLYETNNESMSWDDYHKKYASLRMLCRSCNSKRITRID